MNRPHGRLDFVGIAVVGTEAVGIAACTPCKVRHQSVATLISRGTAPEKPVERAYSPKMAKRIFRNFKFVFFL